MLQVRSCNESGRDKAGISNFAPNPSRSNFRPKVTQSTWKAAKRPKGRCIYLAMSSWFPNQLKLRSVTGSHQIPAENLNETPSKRPVSEFLPISCKNEQNSALPGTLDPNFTKESRDWYNIPTFWYIASSWPEISKLKSCHGPTLGFWRANFGLRPSSLPPRPRNPESWTFPRQSWILKSKVGS